MKTIVLATAVLAALLAGCARDLATSNVGNAAEAIGRNNDTNLPGGASGRPDNVADANG